MTDEKLSMRRYVAVLVGGAALIAAACSEPLAPGAPLQTSAITAGPSALAASRRDRDHTEAHYTFAMSPFGGEASLGPYTLRYDASAICDPASSGYGLDEWVKSCKTMRRPVVLVARVWYEDGRAYIEMNRDLRFDPSKNVTLSTRVSELRGEVLTDELRAQYAISYTTVVNGERVFMDDASWDPSLATVFRLRRDGRAEGTITRRILHFSGYYVRSGRLCSEDGDGGRCSNSQGEDEQY